MQPPNKIRGSKKKKVAKLFIMQILTGLLAFILLSFLLKLDAQLKSCTVAKLFLKLSTGLLLVIHHCTP
jgi:hypothetical protein